MLVLKAVIGVEEAVDFPEKHPLVPIVEQMSQVESWTPKVLAICK